MALRNPALSGTQTSRCSGDSGWSMKTLAKVSDMLIDKFFVPYKPWLPACLHGTKCRESVGEGLIHLNALSHPLNCQGLVTKAKYQNGGIWGNFRYMIESKLSGH